jgi:hypothetical protein
MKRSDNDTRTDPDQHETRGTAAGTVFGWLFRLLRSIFRRNSQQGGRAVVTGSATSTVTAVVACLGASATDATGSYDWIADLARRPENVSVRFYRFAEGATSPTMASSACPLSSTATRTT